LLSLPNRYTTNSVAKDFARFSDVLCRSPLDGEFSERLQIDHHPRLHCAANQSFFADYLFEEEALILDTFCSLLRDLP